MLCCAALWPLLGCAVAERADSQVISSDQDHVVVRAGRYVNPGDVAEAHCSSHGKTAALTDAFADQLNSGLYTFECR